MADVPTPVGETGRVESVPEAAIEAAAHEYAQAGWMEPSQHEQAIERTVSALLRPSSLGRPSPFRAACSSVWSSALAVQAAEIERLRADSQRLRDRVHTAVDEVQRRYAAYQQRCDRFDAISKWARSLGSPESAFWSSTSSAIRSVIMSLTEERDLARAELAEAKASGPKIVALALS